MTSSRATTLGLGAVGLWALLAALTLRAGAIPPFQLTAMTFTVGTLVGLLYARLTGQSLAILRDVPAAAWALGIFGLFGFHVVYFLALQSAPVLEASLLVYLWPLLIVVFSGVLPASAGGAALSWRPLLGAALGFAGAILILRGDVSTPAAFARGSLVGYGLALAAAVIWASYSVASRLFATVPSLAVIGSCAATTVGAAILHLLFETWTWPRDTAAWLSIAALGLGPTGLAFYLWDDGMKRGNLRLLGVAAYATPLLSTLVLTALGLAQPGSTVWIAALLITAGAAIAGTAEKS